MKTILSTAQKCLDYPWRFRETGRPDDNIEAYDLWNNTHTATLEDYRITGDELYHPDAPLW